MTPIKTDAEPAPEWLLKFVRKTHAELHYVHEETTESSAWALVAYCCGQSWTNAVMEDIIEDNLDDSDDDGSDFEKYFRYIWLKSFFEI